MTTPAASDPASPLPRRPALVPTLAAIVVVALCVTAGLWQRDRMHQKLALRAALDAAVAQAPVPLPATTEWSAWRFRAVTVTGTFDAAHQILLDNRVRGGRAGYDVITPLVLPDRRTVLVDRGWIAAGPSRTQVPQVPPPAEEVTISGRLNLPPGAYLELARSTTDGARWQNLDLKRMEAMLGRPVLPVLVEQTAPLRSGDDLVRTRPAPDFGVDTHRMYMVQWFIFAAMAAALWAWFTFRHKR